MTNALKGQILFRDAGKRLIYVSNTFALHPFFSILDTLGASGTMEAGGSLRAGVKPGLKHAEKLSFFSDKEGAGVDACQGN